MMRLLKHLINPAYSKLSYQKRSLSLVGYELESGVYSVDARNFLVGHSCPHGVCKCCTMIVVYGTSTLFNGTIFHSA